MNPSDEITLKAFLTALQELKEPLPPNVQTHLNDVAKQLESNPMAIAQLEAIPPQFPSLNAAYMKAKQPLQQEATARNKGKAETIATMPDDVRTDLLDRAVAIFKATDSVEATQVEIASNSKGGWKRLVALFSPKSADA